MCAPHLSDESRGVGTGQTLVRGITKRVYLPSYGKLRRQEFCIEKRYQSDGSLDDIT
jgi:hypothetical protein